MKIQKTKTICSSLPVSDIQPQARLNMGQDHIPVFFKGSEIIRKRSELLFLVNSTETGITGPYSGLFLAAHLENYWVFWATGQECVGQTENSIYSYHSLWVLKEHFAHWFTNCATHFCFFLKVFGQQVVSMWLKNKEEEEKSGISPELSWFYLSCLLYYWILIIQNVVFLFPLCIFLSLTT